MIEVRIRPAIDSSVAWRIINFPSLPQSGSLIQADDKFYIVESVWFSLDGQRDDAHAHALLGEAPRSSWPIQPSS